jgi:hypothetical protein
MEGAGMWIIFPFDFGPEDIETLNRKRLARLMKQKPEAFKDHLISSLMARLQSCFKNSSFGIISPCQEDQLKKDKLETMCSFADNLRNKGINYIAHKGFWELIDPRCFLIPCIERKKMELLALEVGQDSYYWGEKSHWQCFRKNQVVKKGSYFQVIEIDEEFFMYYKIKKSKENLIKLRSKVSGGESKEIISDIERKLIDLNRIEEALLGARK